MSNNDKIDDDLKKIAERASAILGPAGAARTEERLQAGLRKEKARARKLRETLTAKLAQCRQRPSEAEQTEMLKEYIHGRIHRIANLRPEGCPLFHNGETRTGPGDKRNTIKITFTVYTEPLYLDVLDWTAEDAEEYLREQVPVGKADTRIVEHDFKVKVEPMETLGTVHLSTIDEWGRPKFGGPRHPHAI